MNRTSIFVVVLVAFTFAGCCVIAVQRFDNAKCRTMCIDNLKSIGLALHNYHDTHKHLHLPDAVAHPPTKEFSPDKQLSWLSGLIVYLDSHMDPNWIVDDRLPWDHAKNRYVASREIRVYLCAANERRRGEIGGLAHYVGLTGVGKDAAWLPLGHPDAGVFGYERVTRFEDMKKGTANVIMVAETATDNGPWVQGGHGTARGLDVDGVDYLGEYGQFNSFHGRRYWIGGIAFTTNVLMADGTVRALTSDTSDRVFESLVRINGFE